LRKIGREVGITKKDKKTMT